jgi:hypothetical protein
MSGRWPSIEKISSFILSILIELKVDRLKIDIPDDTITMKPELTDMIINLSRFEGNEDIISRVKAELARRKQNKPTTENKMTREDLKNYIREAIQKRLMENQPSPSRETEPGETETIPDRGTEEEKKRRRIGNPDVKPRPKAMNENEQEIIKRIVARYKSGK